MLKDCYEIDESMSGYGDRRIKEIFAAELSQFEADSIKLKPKRRSGESNHTENPGRSGRSGGYIRSSYNSSNYSDSSSAATTACSIATNACMGGGAF